MSDRVLEEIEALQDEDWALREEAAALLGDFADPRAIPPLIRVLHDEDRAVREAAAMALRKIGQAALPALVQALKDPNGNVQEAAISVLKDFPDPSTVEPLIECLASKNWILRMHAVKALGQSSGERVVQALIPLLMDPVKAVRVDTTEALARLGAAALTSLLDALDGDEWILRLHACEALGKMGAEEAVPPLCELMLSDRDAAVRQDAAKALGGIGNARALEPLSAALQDLEVRPFAVEALGKIKDVRAVPTLIDIVTGKGRPANARRAANCGDETGEQFFEEMEVQEHAIGALADIGDDRAIDPVIGALQDTRLRSAAAAALGRFGLRVADPLLARMKTETNSNILYHARAVLTSVGWRPRPNMKAGI
jgi:HEAT repeat protein